MVLKKNSTAFKLKRYFDKLNAFRESKKLDDVDRPYLLNELPTFYPTSRLGKMKLQFKEI